MISKNEHMINALIARLEELREGKFGPVEELSYNTMIQQIFDITKNYTTDRRDLLNLAAFTNLTPQEIKVLSEMNYEDNSK